MKKSLIALAALATTAAFAQSSVNLTGLIGFANQSQGPDGLTAATTSPANPAGGTSGFALTDASINLNATEDLGGGMKATAAMSLDTASPAFGNPLNRRNTSIGLTGDFGSVNLANTRSSDLLTRAMVAPSNLPQGMYDSSGIITRERIDLISYGLKFGDIQPYVAYTESGLASNLDGSSNKAVGTTIFGANYASGPLAAGVAFKRAKIDPLAEASASAVLAATGDVLHKNNVELFATYDLGVAKLGFGLDGKRTKKEKDAIAFGVAVPLGAMTVGMNYAERKDVQVGASAVRVKATVQEFAVKYDLSKRTNVNFSYGKHSWDGLNVNGQANGNDGKQHRLGIYHAF